MKFHNTSKFNVNDQANNVEIKISSNAPSQGSTWLSKAAQVNTEEDRIPSMSSMFSSHHGDMFKLLDRHAGNNISLRNHMGDDRQAFADGGTVETVATDPDWATGAQAMKNGGETMHVHWSGKNGRIS